MFMFTSTYPRKPGDKRRQKNIRCGSFDFPGRGCGSDRWIAVKVGVNSILADCATPFCRVTTSFPDRPARFATITGRDD